MKYIECLTAGLVCIAGALHAGAADPAKPPAPDAAAEGALADIETALKRGDVGWWRSEADPAIQFTAKYTGFGGDAVTALSLNQAEAIWPAFKHVSEGLDQFGAACVVYNCLKYSCDGQYNKAALEGMKWFLMNRLKQVGEHGAISASGVGLIDFALNSFGEAAMQQIQDDYWGFYCRYQAELHPHLADYARLIKDGANGQKGFPALAASLDTFWEVPESQAIRGFYTLSTQDPDYQATFRNRYIQQNVLPFLLQWAEHEQGKARTTAWLAAKKYTEQIQATTFVVELPVRERGLGDAPNGLIADLLVYDQKAKDELRLLASAPVTRDLKLEAPLSALLNDSKMSYKVVVRLHRAGAPDPSTAPKPSSFEIFLRDAAMKWKREGQPGRLVYRPRDPIWVETQSDVRVRCGGSSPNKITSVLFHRLPSAGLGDMGDNSNRPNYEGCGLTEGRGTVRLMNGRYLVASDPPLAAETVITVKGDMEYTVTPVIGGDASAPTPPDPARFRELTRKMSADVRSRARRAPEAIADSVEARAAFWQESLTAFYARDRAAALLAIKCEEDMHKAGVTPAQAVAIENAAQEKIAEIRKGTEAGRAAQQKVCRESMDEVGGVEREQEKRRQEIAKEYEASRSDLQGVIAKLRTLFGPTEVNFIDVTRGVTQGSYSYDTITSFKYSDDQGIQTVTGPEAAEKQLEDSRKRLSQIESDVAQIIGESEKLPAAIARHAKALAVVRDTDEREGVRIYNSLGDVVRQDEVNAISVRAEIQGDPRIVEEARDHVRRGERMVQRRKERRRRVEEALRKVEAAAAQLPAVDEGVWKARVGGITTPLKVLFEAAAAADGAEDTESFRKLAGDMDAFFREQVEICGDLLEDTEKRETPFSRFRAAHQALLDLGAAADWPKDFLANTITPGVQKVNARGKTVGGALRARKDIRLWLAAGNARAERLAALKRFVAGFEEKPGRRGVEQRLADIEARARLIEQFPSRLPSPPARAEMQKRLDAERAALAASGEVEDFWRSKAEPFVVFKTVNDSPFGRAFYWKVEEELPKDAAPEAVLKVDGIADDAPVLIRRSDDGGRTWRNLVPKRGRFSVRLPIGPAGAGKSIIFSASLPRGREAKWSAYLPSFHLP